MAKKLLSPLILLAEFLRLVCHPKSLSYEGKREGIKRVYSRIRFILVEAAQQFLDRRGAGERRSSKRRRIVVHAPGEILKPQVSQRPGNF